MYRKRTCLISSISSPILKKAQRTRSGCQIRINRADERFWEAYDWFQKRSQEDEPVHSGLFDLNRYYHTAR